MWIYVDHNVKFSFACAFICTLAVSDSLRCLCSLSTECGSSPEIETEFPAGICVEKDVEHNITQHRDVSSPCTSTPSASRLFCSKDNEALVRLVHDSHEVVLSDAKLPRSWAAPNELFRCRWRVTSFTFCLPSPHQGVQLSL